MGRPRARIFVDPKGFVWLGGNADNDGGHLQVHQGRQIR